MFVECITPQPAALIFGGGHISKSLAKVLDLAGFRVSVVDNREAFANRERFPEAAEVHAEEYEDVYPKLTITESTFIVIVTRGHRDDMRVLRWAVTTPARYISMIGSKRKVIAVIKELEKEGLSPESFESVYAPMGFEIGAVSPEEIAISVAAEMIAMRRDPEGNWRTLSKSIFLDEHLREQAAVEASTQAESESGRDHPRGGRIAPHGAAQSFSAVSGRNISFRHRRRLSADAARP